MSKQDRFAAFVQTTTGKHVSRRSLVKGAASLGAAAAASSVFAVPMINAQEKGKVTFWTTHSDIGLKALQQIGTDFNAQSTTSEVEVVQRPPADVTDSSSLITAVRGGEGPDVYLLDRFIVAERAAQGLLQELNPLMEAAGVCASVRYGRPWSLLQRGPAHRFRRRSSPVRQGQRPDDVRRVCRGHQGR
jgi:ABC-type glycerol-3-phosphate transport system substrate-binding protein